MVQTNKSQWIRVTVLLATLVFGLITVAAPAEDKTAQDKTAQTESAQENTDSPKYREFESTPLTEDSFVFLNGVYLHPPLDIKFSNEGIEIDGQFFDETAFDLSSYVENRRWSGRGYGFRGMDMRGRGDRGEWGGRGNWGDRGEWGDRAERGREYLPRAPFQSLAESFTSSGSGVVAVFYSGEAPLLLDASEQGHELLKALLGRETPSEAELMSSGSERIDFELWHRLVQDFKISPEFATRASEEVNRLEQIYETNDRKTAAFMLSQQIAFPLSMIAMVTVVLAFGHLMAHPQQMVAISDDPLTLANAKKATVWSLTIVGVLSALDLVWTLIAHQSGAMRELNPLGNGLIHDPVQLILFKITVTGLAIGILYYLHEQPLARRATWWCCLVLTLLTARWLTFNSMFL